MGVIFDNISIRNILVGGEPVELRVKVDTGATMLVLPGWLQEQLRFPVIRTATVRYANEETAQREVVYGVEVIACGRRGVFDAVIEPARRDGLLGVIVIEELDLIADTRSQKLYPNPRSPDIPMIDIEESG